MSISSVEFNEIIKFPFQDPKWFSRLCLQGGALMALSMFIVGIPFTIGYIIRCIQKGVAGDTMLPDWSEWGEFWKLGVRGFLANLVYLLPMAILWSFIGVLIIVVIIALEANPNADALALVIPLVAFLGYGLSMVYSLVLWFVQPAIFTAIAAGADVRTAANPKVLWAYIKTNFAHIILGIAIAYLAGMIASFGMFVFFIGYFLTAGFGMAVTGYTYGIIYRQSSYRFT